MGAATGTRVKKPPGSSSTGILEVAVPSLPLIVPMPLAVMRKQWSCIASGVRTTYASEYAPWAVNDL